MDTYTGFSGVYQNQPNMYYQPTSTQPIYTQRNWQSYYQVPSVMNQQSQYAQPQQAMNSSMVWVQGESGAKAYALPNNTTLPLWDSEDQVIYIKSVDANGKPSMTILTYTERDDNHVDAQHEEYATKQQIESINEKFNEINEKLAVMGKYVTKEQFDSLNTHLDDLCGQIEDIEDRITSFGKPQQNSNSSNRRGNK